MAGATASFMLDTGAAVTLRREDRWKETKNAEAKLEVWQDPNLVGAYRTQIAVLGQVKTDVLVAGWRNIRTKYGDHQGAGGRRHSRDGRVRRDQYTSSLSVSVGRRWKSWRVSETNDTSSRNERNGSTAVSPKQLGTRTCLLEGVVSRRLPAMAGRAMVSPESDEVVVRLLNATEESVIMYKGSKIAELEPLDEGGLITGVTTESERPSEGKTAASVEKQHLCGHALTEKVVAQLSTDEKEHFTARVRGRFR